MRGTDAMQWTGAMGLLVATGLVQASPDALDKCAFNAQREHGGQLVALRAEIEAGEAQYQIDSIDSNGVRREVECDPETGTIRQTERNVAPDDPAFTGKAKVRLDAALKTALGAHSGQVLGIEYELEADGQVAYEFDIRNADGDILEVEVNAVDGKLEGAEQVLYQIGHR